MRDEYNKPPHNHQMPIPAPYNWESPQVKSGDELETHYKNYYRELGNEKACLGRYSQKARTRYKTTKLYKLIALSMQAMGINGCKRQRYLYEGLLEKNAEDTKSGAILTPRALIKTMVECIRPSLTKPLQTQPVALAVFSLRLVDRNAELDKAKSNSSNSKPLPAMNTARHT